MSRAGENCQIRLHVSRAASEVLLWLQPIISTYHYESDTEGLMGRQVRVYVNSLQEHLRKSTAQSVNASPWRPTFVYEPIRKKCLGDENILYAAVVKSLNGRVNAKSQITS